MATHATLGLPMYAPVAESFRRARPRPGHALQVSGSADFGLAASLECGNGLARHSLPPLARVRAGLRAKKIGSRRVATPFFSFRHRPRGHSAMRIGPHRWPRSGFRQACLS